VNTKRATILLLAVLVLGAAAFSVFQSQQTARTAEGPVVLISIDTLRADRLPAYGYTQIRTPHIDRLVTDSVLFEHAYSHSPQTLPAHTSIFSGRLPFEHGVRDNIGFSVKTGERLLPHLLGERGFATGGFVSAYVLRQQTGIHQGFGLWDDQLPPASPDRPLGQVQRGGEETVAAAIRWIDQQPSSKFFLFVHIYEPHRPYTPPARFAASVPYDGEVEHSDEIVGRLLDHLRTRNLYQEATIVLLSDHGEGLGDHGEDEHGIFLYRETIQVPLVLKQAGSRGGGRRISAPVQHVDLVPTILDLVGAPIPDGARGRSLRPVLEGSATLEETSIYSESLSPRYHFGWSELYALSDTRYRLIRAPRDELYDLAHDPRERTSMTDERPHVRTAMRRALDEIIAHTHVDAPVAVSSEDREKLAALGYVGTHTAASLEFPGDQLPDPKDKIGILRKYKRATDLAGEARFAEATAVYRELLREDPEMTDVWLQLAEIYGRRGMTAESVAAYKEVVGRKPKDPAGLTGAAAGLLRLGRLDEARAHAELAVEVAPAAAHQLLMKVAVERGDIENARREARRAQAVDPSLPLPTFVEGLLLHRQGQLAAALPHFLEARRAMQERTVQLTDVNYHIGDTLGRLERYSEAEPFFRAELELSPGHLRARAGLAMLYRVTGRITDSEQAIVELLRHAPTPEGYDVAAQLWTMFGEPQRAAAVRTEAKRLAR
jgi:choline-sulfatase